ncbi:MAG TPA: ABC transporter transmembrane domain-containing protein, partial [Solirubrobacteraceae bacterium]|nr:ABC transporter transmembrane domain-containing protein [Solirubrobacteraceae bacterium]
LRGVTYGTFRPDPQDIQLPPPHVVHADFAAMHAAGINAIRMYTPPPPLLLDIAAEHKLRVLVGLPWEQHVAFLDDAARCRDIERRVREAARACAGHAALLGLVVGNEIPASIVRWHGRRRIERFLGRLCDAAREEAPESLVTYVNFPSTEYLEVPSVDLVCFNVFLEHPDQLAAYLPRLQSLAGDRPLVLTELGLDSRRNGQQGQAASLTWQLETAFRAGAAGSFVFSWTDEWHRGGDDVIDWDFGLVDRAREPKRALSAVRDVYATLPTGDGESCPRISVVVCTRNGARTLRECLDGLSRLDYPNFETIVVDDGSRDETAGIIDEYDVRRIQTPGLGLSAARNIGLEAASGEVVAYLDDDAWPDPHWLRYVAAALADARFAAVGGPNLSPPGEGAVAQCVANAPGGPVHVLLTDELAEHIPGCNMAFRRDALLAIGGFDGQFRTAGDDVDICWRLQDAGHQVGFHAGAVVWHRRRSSVRAFWRQQRGYGHAEALLERKWPERYNAAGHVNWTGRIYGPGGVGLFRRWRVYYGTWGSAAFQSRHEAPAPPLTALPLMPEWYLVLVLLAGLTALGALWTPMLAAAPLLLAAAATVIAQAAHGARRARFAGTPTRARNARLRALTALLYIIQGAARLRGRVAHGLAPWGRRARLALRPPRARRRMVWSEQWRPAEAHLAAVEAAVRHGGARLTRGGEYDRWDLQVRGGGLGSARLRLAVEEHGRGRQQLLYSVWPVLSLGAVAGTAVTAALSAAAGLDGATTAALVLAGACGVLLLAAMGEIVAAWSLALAATVAPPAQPPAPAAGDATGDPLGNATGDPLAGPRKSVSLRRRLSMLGYLRPHLRDVLIVAVSLGLGTALTLAQPWPIKLLVDNVLGHHHIPGLLRSAVKAVPGDPAHALLLLIVAGSVAIFLLGTIVEMLSSVAVTRLGQRVTYGLAGDVFAHLQRLSIAFHARRPVGDTIARVGSDTFGVQGLLMGAVIPTIHSLATLGAMFLVMWQLSMRLTLLALLVIPLQLLAIVAFGRPMKRRSRERLDQEGRLVAVVEQTLTAIPVVQAFTRERIENDRFGRYADRTVRAYVRETVTGMWFKLFAGIATVTGTAGIMYLGADAAIAGHLTAGTIIVFLAYLAGLYGPLDQIAYTVSGFQAASAQLDRVLEVLDTPLDVHDAPRARNLEISRGHVRIEHAVFGYDTNQPVLRDVSIEALPGQVVAIAGPTGAGKTTLVNLLIRFFDPQSGRVTIDGHDVRDYTLRSLRGQIAMVLQDPFILPLTVAENIAYGRPEATREEIEAAARAASAHDFIMHLPQGYDTVIGERGATLSGGEKQRLSIARAFLKDAPVLILDEPTSSLDARTEGALLEAMNRLAEGRTTFIIAHRLSTIRDADRIVVLDDGRVIEQGRHEELIVGDHLYRHLYDQQMNVARHDRILGGVDGVNGNGATRGPRAAEVADVAGAVVERE